MATPPENRAWRASVASQSWRYFFALNLLILLCLSLGDAKLHGLSHDELAQAEQAAAASPVMPPEFTIDMPIDHFNQSDLRTYKNRYWVNATYYKEGGPIFLYDGGESGVSNGAVLVVLAEYVGPSAPMALARKYNGVAVLWEHRFYGKSLPFKVDNISGLALEGHDAYKYLTNEQALEDTIYFAQNFKPANLQGHWHSLTPNNAPWVFIGGSYPGIRAAMVRERNPETWFASWASSAPVEAQVDMSVYFNPMQQSMTCNCSTDMHAAIDYADGVLLNGTKDEIAQVRHAVYLLGLLNPLVNVTLYNVTGPYPASEADMTTWVWAQIINYAIEWSTNYYQSSGFAVALLPFCNDIERYNPAASGALPSTVTSSEPPDVAQFVHWLENSFDGNPSDAGIAATYNASTAFNALLSATYAKMLNDNSTYTPSTYPSQSDTISWTWQYCSQFGYFQDSNLTNPNNLVSRFNNVSSEERNYCRNIFPYAPAMPNVSSIISKYGGWRMTPSNVMFSNGEVDPWRTLGVQADQKINPNAFVRQSTTEIPTCNQPPPDDRVFGQVYPGQVHAQDLIKRRGLNQTTTAPFDLGFDLFTQAFDAWRPCFGNSTTKDSAASPVSSSGTTASWKSSMRNMAAALTQMAALLYINAD